MISFQQFYRLYGGRQVRSVALSTQVNELQATFKFGRKTPNTIVYKEEVTDDSAEVIGSLYIQKDAASRLGDPKAVVVTVVAAG